ncbi:retrovirus-related pol polyprotein from transposon TNT 1-94 [Tanacetum coccineum]
MVNTLNVTFDETPPPSKISPLVDDDLDEEESFREIEKKNLENAVEDETLEIDDIVNIKESRNHPLENVIGNLNQRTLRSQAQNQSNFFCFISTIEPKNVNEALGDESWIVAMQEELNQFIANDVWELVPQPRNMTIIGTKWVFRNKLDENGMVDNTLFTKKKSSNLIIVQIYVDDIIFGSTCQDMCDEFAKIMHDEFEMSMMGELNFFLGLQIKQMEDGIFFNQSKYIKEMLKKFGLEDSKPMKTPMSSDTKLTKDEECESVDSTKYRGMIGSLLYLTASRPDIMFSVCLCARFQEAPKTSHLEAVKRIFRYIKGTMHLGLWYPKGTGIETVVYADSDHAGDYVDQKSTSGICTFVGCCLTSWFLKKQTALAISTTEAEYVSAKKACQQALWMKQALIDYDSLFHFVEFECLLEINEQVCPCFILEFYSQYRLSYSDKGQMFVEFVFQNQYFSLSLEDFAQILRIAGEGAYVFSDQWSLDELVYGAPSEGPYQTNLPSPGDIISYVRKDREGQVTRIRYQEEIEVQDYQILTREIVSTLKPLEEIIRENWVTKQARLILPYGMLLTRLLEFIIGENLELQNESYVLYDRVMNPLAAQLEQKQERIVAREEVVILLLRLSPSINHPHLISMMMMMMMMMGMTKEPRVQALLPPFVIDEEVTTTPSPTTTSLSPTPPNAPSKTLSTNQTSSNQDNTSSSFQPKLQILPPSSNEPTSPQPLNPLLENILDVPPRPLNPQPLQSHPSLDITLSLSPITPLNHIHDTLSPPSSPQPQLPIMGHPLFYNYHDYHGSTCICCFHNRNLHLNLRDEMNNMFAHLKYLLTTALTTYFPPPP